MLRVLVQGVLCQGVLTYKNQEVPWDDKFLHLSTDQLEIKSELLSSAYRQSLSAKFTDTGFTSISTKLVSSLDDEKGDVVSGLSLLEFDYSSILLSHPSPLNSDWEEAFRRNMNHALATTYRNGLRIFIEDCLGQKMNQRKEFFAS
ncbi:unnamed protein product [Echinostoma caproni]|uniref:SEA domain-containing protein n=1 Tax=Echinostoma caproni TaxID=27848 RepID=A0A183A6J2_9TREM|nr:unnamed protein product [Echinostoma caproni]